MQLFYDPNIVDTGGDVFFSREESKHIIRVLRKNEGDLLRITNGKGSIFQVELVHVSQNECVARIIISEEQSPLPYSLHLAVSPTKLNDRYEWFLEKVTEIGVTEITPIVCDHSERKVIKADRFERKIISAMKQSLKARLPALHGITTFKDFIESNNDYDKRLVAHCAEGQKASIKQIVQPGASVCILIGPEGDFSSEEIQLAAKEGFEPIHLGDSRLRTETAAVVACHSIAFINEV